MRTAPKHLVAKALVACNPAGKIGYDLLALLVEHEVVAGSLHTQLLQTGFRDINAMRGLQPNETAVFVPSQDIECGRGHISFPRRWFRPASGSLFHDSNGGIEKHSTGRYSAAFRMFGLQGKLRLHLPEIL